MHPQPLSLLTNTQLFSQKGLMIELRCENLSVRCIWLHVIYMSRTSFRVNPHLEWITIRTVKYVCDMIIMYSINWSCGIIFVCFLKISIFHSSQLIKILLKRKKLFTLLIMKHEKSPEGFPPEKKMRETYNNNQISSGYPDEHHYLNTFNC